MGLEILAGGDRELPSDQPEWEEAVATLGLPISPYVAKAAYVAGVLGQTIEAAKSCWYRDPEPPFVLAAFTLAGSAVDLLGHCLGKVGNKERLTEGLRFLETMPFSRSINTPMPVDELIAVRHFTTHGAVHSTPAIVLSVERWLRVMEPLNASPSVFWAAGRPDDEKRFSAFAQAKITVLGLGFREPVFIRDVYDTLTAAD